MKKTMFFAFLLMLSCHYSGLSQSVGYVMPSKYNSVEVPFSYLGNFIVLDIKLSGFLPMKFIYDTGAESTLLIKPDIAKALGMKYSRKYSIMGSDMDTTLVAYLIKDVEINFSEGRAPSQDILVLDRDFFNMEEYIGQDIQGILGADIFKDYIVTIDYRARMMTINKKGTFKPNKSYTRFRMRMEKNKPHINTTIHLRSGEVVKAKMLIDSGAAISMLIDADESKGLNLPEKTIKGNIGYGISGEIEGYLGRVNSLKYGEFHFPNLISYFRVFGDKDVAEQRAKLDQKDGLIGNAILQNFKCVYDFPGKRLYLRPYYANYNKRINFDRSGMTMIQVGENYENFMVNQVFVGSPAHEVGIQKGDIIKSINGFPTALMSYDKVVHKFQKQKDKTYKIKVIREGESHLFELTLRDII